MLGKKGEPLAIGALERFAADFERETDQVACPGKAARTGQPHRRRRQRPGRPDDGRRHGRQGPLASPSSRRCTSPGGVLVYGIPEFRLPEGHRGGGDRRPAPPGRASSSSTASSASSTASTSCFELGFDAVYVATGAGLPGFMGLPGENLCNIVSANEYLTRVNLMKAYRFPEYDTPAPTGAQVAVVGGGNVAMDCARTALRMGAREVTIVYRRTRDEMPARAEEIEHAEQEGVRFAYLTSPIALRSATTRAGCGRWSCVRMTARRPRRLRPPAAGPDARLRLPHRRRHGHRGRGRRPEQGALFEDAAGLERNERGYIRRLTRVPAARACPGCGRAATSSPERRP